MTIDQIKCYDDFSKHGLLMNFLHQAHERLICRLDKIDGIFVFSVHICRLSLSVILCHVHRVYLVFLPVVWPLTTS